VYFFISAINTSEVLGVLRDIQIEYLLLGAFFFLCYMLTYVVRWGTILDYYKVRIPFHELAKIVFVGSVFGDFTPSRVGDLSRIYLLKKHHGVPSALSVYTIALDKSTPAV